ncbi:hypothetical protein GGR26_002478 [Lewinella marina]|uniref:Uncharacterized protein n=1 Tax=Neolewinella marina TaxID=438751 RepID=A0A2G0CBZ9_9BACT|nr:hypothetical protein [Neolewinella marina]NJB86701.1 hypothetical protein [Neolewinella marina]PHK97508.1 hypothetical protein CGL56_15530 [Neolewinella marina]
MGKFLGTCVPALLILLTGCGTPDLPRKIRLPPVLNEASGLVIDGQRMIWHNDSGDGPYLYTTDLRGQLLGIDTLEARAVDYEDICADENGLIYVGDFGNNRGERTSATIYTYDPGSGRTDSIRYTYPGQDGGGRLRRGNYDCEAMVASDGYLHLFTKDILFGDRPFYIYHFRLPAHPGSYTAELVDSLYLPRRVITGATLDRDTRELFLVAYNYRTLLGFLPTGAASVITVSDYPGDRFFRGRLRRRNLAWAVPTQHEAVSIYGDEYLYIAAEATRIRRRAIARRVRR